MPRNSRCILPENPYHITQRGTNRQRIFFTARDRRTYVDLLRSNIDDAGVRILAYCLMPNHVHLIAMPARGIPRRSPPPCAWPFCAIRQPGQRTHRTSISQSLLFVPFVDESPLDGHPLRRVQSGPSLIGLRARGLPLVQRRRPSGHRIRQIRYPRHGLLGRNGGREVWRQLHGVEEDPEKIHLLRRCTYCGRPFGEEAFVREVEESFRRVWRRWAFESTRADSQNSPNHTTAPSPSQKTATCQSVLSR